MRTVILGAGGQLAYDLQRVMADWDLIPLSHADLDICDYPRVRRVLTEQAPELVINTAAFVRVDDCEDQVEKAFEVNAFAARHLAQVCSELNCVLVHLSTDYVFGGEKRTPYREDDLPNPLSVYGATKLVGEYFVRNICAGHYVVRTAGLFGIGSSSGEGGNFIDAMIFLAEDDKPIRVVDDQVVSPTYTFDLAAKLIVLVESEPYGIYHIANGGECSWYEFALAVFDIMDMEAHIFPTTSQKFKSKALRPAYSVLASSSDRLRDMQEWRDALARFLAEKGYG